MSNNSKVSTNKQSTRSTAPIEIRNGSGFKDNSNLESLLKKTK